MPNLIGQSLGRYHILEQLGEGGMATVYKAFDTRLETDVAVKIIRTEVLSQNAIDRALKRFEREAKALAKLTHPNIVKVTDYGEYEGKPYLVMPYLPGGTLKQMLKSQPMPWKEAARLLIPVARALDYAHRQGMVHRDVKPSNILITADGEPMLTDFGIAKIIDEEATVDLTGTSATVGTPEYMAPEQVISKSVDHRADIYALGVVFYEMVTGRKPFQADTPMAVLFKHASEPLPNPRSIIPDLPVAIERILIKSLAKKPEDRYQSMGEFAAALEGLNSVSTIAKTKESAPKREHPVIPEKTAAAGPGTNRKRWIPIAALVALMGIGLAIGSGFLLLREKGYGFFPYSANTTFSPTPVSTLNNPPAPRNTATKTPEAGTARVDQVNGTGANLEIGQYIDSGTTIHASSNGVQVLVGRQGGQPGVMYWFGGSAGQVMFDLDMMKPVLQNGALYVKPSEGSSAEVYFSQWPGNYALVTGSQMIVEKRDSEIWIYCFDGTCRLAIGLDEKRVPVGSKQSNNMSLRSWGAAEAMNYDEMWMWNVKCNYCMVYLIATPTPTANFTQTNHGNGPTTVPTRPWNTLIPPPPTNTPHLHTQTPVPHTAVPPTPRDTSVPPPPMDTSVPPTPMDTSVPPTWVPPTSEPPTAVPPTWVPHTSEPPTSEPPTSVPPPPTTTPVPIP